MIKHLQETVTTQLVMTMAVLPFVATWGLSLSLLSVAGNLIHSLFLTPFLFLSSIIFCTELLGIPNRALIALLALLHRVWAGVLSLAPATVTIGITPLTAATAFFTLAAFFAWRTRHTRAAGALLALSLGLSIVNAALPHRITTLHNNTYTLTCTPRNDGVLLLSDNGFISRTKNTESLITYTVLPHIRQHYGTPKRILLQAQNEGMRIRNARKLLRTSVIK